MKKFLILILTAALAASASCAPQPSATQSATGLTPEGSPSQQAQTPSAPPTAEASPTHTPGASSTEPAQSEQPTDPEQLGYNANNIVGIDKFGRTFDVIGGERSNKQVGMFFWLWLGVESHNGTYGRFSGVYDATKIMEQYGKETLFMQENPLDENGKPISPNGAAHWWGEPLWGYYRSDDTYVIRKQLELLTIAGIDFIYFDTTNAVTYKPSYTPILKTISEMRAEGWDAPQAVFYTHSRSMQTTKSLYNTLYSRNVYPDAWYMVDGKPLIIAYTNPADDKAEAVSRGDNNYQPPAFSQEILDFFTFKKPQWPSDPVYPDGFPWIEWAYPQPKHGDVMNVTVASHPNVPMSLNLINDLVGGSWKNWGRGYDPITGKNNPDKAEQGQLFQYTWDAALEADPDMISVGGWNEWVAYKQWYLNHYMLCDAASMEFSRDIEMMKGGYEDSFYIQLIKNVRAYKGTAAGQKAVGKTIDISGNISQWEDVLNIYRAIGKENFGRDSTDCSGKTPYVMEAPRNNLQEIKAAHDKDYLYFYIRSEKAITGKGSNWMNIFIGTGSPSQKGWQGYEYVINRSVDGSKGSIEKLSSDFKGKNTGWAELKLSGEILQVKIPRSAVGLDSSAEFYFKVADGVENTDDIMDYYVTGKSLPLGRLSFKYNG